MAANRDNLQAIIAEMREVRANILLEPGQIRAWADRLAALELAAPSASAPAVRVPRPDLSASAPAAAAAGAQLTDEELRVLRMCCPDIVVRGTNPEDFAVYVALKSGGFLRDSLSHMGRNKDTAVFTITRAGVLARSLAAVGEAREAAPQEAVARVIALSPIECEARIKYKPLQNGIPPFHVGDRLYAAPVAPGAEVEELVRQIHQQLKRGERTQDHGLMGNLKCILDHVIPDPPDMLEPTGAEWQTVPRAATLQQQMQWHQTQAARLAQQIAGDPMQTVTFPAPQPPTQSGDG